MPSAVEIEFLLREYPLFKSILSTSSNPSNPLSLRTSIAFLLASSKLKLELSEVLTELLVEVELELTVPIGDIPSAWNIALVNFLTSILSTMLLNSSTNDLIIPGIASVFPVLKYSTICLYKS